ncbi:YraN family protein [Faecalispora anaeroviscerum]|uniref:YraN family protein n=1 Tax=Faecalispora anaeroviscerum TaxID=2991836 RepID=UPI0024B8EAFD|nr:YraN family protein [Faecalispora anaeroviscerum]
MDNRSGKTGETYVVQLLQERGCRILCRNYRSRFGEIDIIAQDGSYLVFVEVKTRGNRCLGSPQEAVTASKRRKLILTATQYLSKGCSELQPRFDVAVVRTDEAGQALSAEFFENAFDAEGSFA